MYLFQPLKTMVKSCVDAWMPGARERVTVRARTCVEEREDPFGIHRFFVLTNARNGLLKRVCQNLMTFHSLIYSELTSWQLLNPTKKQIFAFINLPGLYGQQCSAKQLQS